MLLPVKLTISGLAVLVVSCTGAAEPTMTPLLTSAAELSAARGTVVLVRGPVFHEKLGDGITIDGTTILCADLRLAGAEATLEGRLELWEPPVAETSDAGEISQGVATPVNRWILRDCKQRED